MMVIFLASGSSSSGLTKTSTSNGVPGVKTPSHSTYSGFLVFGLGFMAAVGIFVESDMSRGHSIVGSAVVVAVVTGSVVVGASVGASVTVGAIVVVPGVVEVTGMLAVVGSAVVGAAVVAGAIVVVACVAPVVGAATKLKNIQDKSQQDCMQIYQTY